MSAEAHKEFRPPIGAAAQEAVARLGHRLFEGFFSGPVLERFAVARSGASETRLTLRLADDVLNAAPWELLNDSRSGDYLALTGVSVTRSVPRAVGQARPVRVEGRLRVMVAWPMGIKGSTISDRLAVTVYPPPGIEDLRQSLAEGRPHVVCLAPEVRIDEGGRTSLALNSGEGPPEWIDASQLGSVLLESGSVALVFVASGVASDLGASLVTAGIPAVITTQFPLSKSTVAQLPGILCTKLMAGQTMDAALASTRRDLAAAASDVGALAWAAPVHYADAGADLRLQVVPASPEEAVASSAEAADAPAELAAVSEDARIALGTLSGAENDAVGGEDQLNFSYYVQAFADLITSPYTRPPLTIGIFGSWGMGKSFLLEHIEREVHRRGQSNHAVQQAVRQGQTMRQPVSEQMDSPLHVHVVRFNAWEFSDTDLIWPGMVRKIIRKLDEHVPWPWYKRYWTRLKWNLSRQLQRNWIPVVSAIIASAVAIGVLFWRDHANLAAVLIGAVSLLSVAGLLRAASNPVAQWITKLFAESNYGRQIGYMEDIKHDLETLEGRLHEGGDPDAQVVARILVLVDDLDRCEPDKAVEMLQAVNLLLNFRSFIVCLGIDARIVTGAIEKHYEGLLGAAGASGYEYLDKIVQIPFQIPAPGQGDIVTFIAGLMGNPAPSPTGSQPGSPETAPTGAVASAPTEAAEPSPDDPPAAKPSLPQTEAAGPGGAPGLAVVAPNADAPAALEALVPFTYVELQAFEAVAGLLRPNPRYLKRLVNIYRLVRALARAKNEQLILDSPAATIRWLVMWSQWPYAAHMMLDRYNELLDQWAGTIPADAAAEDPLRYLHNAVAEGLDPSTRSVFDDQPDTLSDLLALPGTGFAWADLHRILAYTVNLNPAVEEQLRAYSAQPQAQAGT
jgi:hypothetical protein